MGRNDENKDNKNIPPKEPVGDPEEIDENKDNKKGKDNKKDKDKKKDKKKPEKTTVISKRLGEPNSKSGKRCPVCLSEMKTNDEFLVCKNKSCLKRLPNLEKKV